MRALFLIACILTVLFGHVGAVRAETTPSWAMSLVAIPGVSLGPVQIGMTRNMVFNRLGFPSEIERKDSSRCGPDCVDVYWRYNLPNENIFVLSWTVKSGIPEEQAGVDFILTDSPRATVGGLVPRTATLREAVTRYGWWENRDGRSFWWAQHSLRLIFDDADVLLAIAVYPRG